MKKIFLFAAAAMITSLAFAQKDKKTPAAVEAAFKTKFPTVKTAKWEKEGNNYEAEFELNNTEQSAVFDAQGNLLETETAITIDQLPKGAADYVNTHYKGQKIKDSEKITDAAGTLTYEAEIKGADLIFDSNGTFIKEVKK